MERTGWRNPTWDGKRKPLLIAITAAGVMLIILFLGNMSYLYGSLFRSNHRVNNLSILAVDYDGGSIGQALIAGYAQIQGDDFPTLYFHSSSEYPTIQDVRNAVCRGDFWAGVVAQPGASDRLSAAIQGGQAARNYQSNDTLTYIYNGVRYAAIELGDIRGNLETLIGAAGAMFRGINGGSMIAAVNTTDRGAIGAFLNPIASSHIDIMPTPQGGRPLLNTVTMVLPMLQQFFFLLALNGINTQFGVYGSLKSTRIGIMRAGIALIYTFIASLTVAGYIWAFREDWTVNSKEFVLTWMTFWLYEHINFLIMDTATAFIPLSFMSFFVMTWIITNITSVVYPFELSPGFYRWAFSLPSHEVYAVLVQIWSGGCNNQLYRALPILFAWEVFGVAGSIAGMLYRNHNAMKELLDEDEKNTLKKAEIESIGSQETLQEKLDSDEVQAVDTGMPIPFVENVEAEPTARPTLKRQGTV